MVQQMASQMRVSRWESHWGNRKVVQSEGSSAAVMVPGLDHQWGLGTTQRSGPLLEQQLGHQKELLRAIGMDRQWELWWRGSTWDHESALQMGSSLESHWVIEWMQRKDAWTDSVLVDRMDTQMEL